MQITFPIITSPEAERSDFLEYFQALADSDFQEMVAISPFVDVFIIENLVRRCVFNSRRLTIVTRYGGHSITNRQRQYINEAINELREIERTKDPSIRNRIVWYENRRVHAKLVIVDWRRVLFGSQNFTQYGGLTGNYELGALIENGEEFEELRTFVSQITAGGTARCLYPD